MLRSLRPLARTSVIFAAAMLWAVAAKGGITITTDPDSATWPEPETGNVIAAGPAVIEVVPDNFPGGGLFAQGLALSSIDLSGGKVASQTFTPAADFKLGAIALLGEGVGTFDTSTEDPNDHLPLSVHLYEIVSGTTGHASLPASYDLSTANTGNTTAVDLFGGGSGLPFQYNGSLFFEFEFVELNFSGTDQVQLQADHIYTFEIWGNSLTGAFNPQRLGAATSTPGGANPYPGGDGYEAADSMLTTARTQFQNASRDLWMAIYEADGGSPPGQAGDFDGDGDVDGADFVAWQTHFPTASGAVLGDGDADGDGDVDGADFVVWQTNFPFTPSPGIATVPEPAAWIMAIVAFSCLVAHSRRGRC